MNMNKDIGTQHEEECGHEHGMDMNTDMYMNMNVNIHKKREYVHSCTFT
jgi:hypothetical protein